MSIFYLGRIRRQHGQILVILSPLASFNSIDCILSRIICHSSEMLKDSILSLYKRFCFIVFSSRLKFILSDHDFGPKDANFFVVRKLSSTQLCLIFCSMSHDLSLGDNLYETIALQKVSSINCVLVYELFFKDKIYPQ